jgi:hypothetical protein
MMSVSSDGRVVLTRDQVKAIIKQSKAVDSNKDDSNKQRPALHAIVKRGEYAYFTDRFTIVRWNLGELSEDIEDNSYIPVDRYYASMIGTSIDGVNLDDWSKLASSKDTLDLLDTNSWTTGAILSFPNLESLFVQHDSVADNSFESVAFNPVYLSNIASILGVVKGEPLRMTPPTHGSPSIKPWMFTRPGYNGMALIMPMRHRG